MINRWPRFVFLTVLLVAVGATHAAGPTVMILMQEKVMGLFGTSGWEVPTQAELTLMEQFSQRGYTVIDPQTLRRNLVQSKGLRMLEGDNKGAAAVGLQHGATLSILGTAISKPAGAKLYGTQMQSIQATLTARVIQNDVARVIATGTATAAKPHIDEVQGGTLAIQEAAMDLAGQLLGQLASVRTPSGAGGGSVVVNISGLKSYRHLDFVMYFFETEAKGVNKVDLRSFTSGVADIALGYQGKIDALARFIATKKFRGFRLEPTYVTANRIDLAVVLDQR